mgnify:CR=1 FL=1
MNARWTKIGRASLATLLLAAAPMVQAESSAWRTALQPDLELTSHLSDRLDIRFGVNRDRPGRDVTRRSQFSLVDESMQFSAMLDWSLHRSGLRMTGGALYDDALIESQSLGMPQLDPEEMRTYFGVGWDNDFGTQGRLGLSLDMGLTFESVGDPLDADAAAPEAANSAFLGDTFESFRYTPSFSAGVEYRF